MQRNSDFIVVIPARYGSKRFPGKPLKNFGIPMIIRTCLQCLKIAKKLSISCCY